MASLKFVLRTRENKNGSRPLVLQITKDRKSSIIHMGIHLTETEWDADKQRIKKIHPNSVRLNNFLLKKLAEANDKSIELETNKTHVSSSAVKQVIKPSAGATFFNQATLYLDNLKKAGKHNIYSADKPRINRFKEFLKGSDIAFSDITPSLLKQFQVYLKHTRTISERTVVNHLVVIRSVFSQAIAANITDQKYYPFGKGKITIKFPDSTKIGLSAEEVKAIEELVIDDPETNHARNVWLLSFYFAGMRVSDVLRLKWSDFQNDRLYYTMGKNDKGGSLKVPDKALRLIEPYRQTNPVHGLVLPDLQVVTDLNNLFAVQQRIAVSVNRLNGHLKKIGNAIGTDKKLTMHISRHTFGNLSGDKIPIQMLQKLYRHSSITTTIGYQNNFIHKDADAALDAVIGF